MVSYFGVWSERVFLGLCGINQLAYPENVRKLTSVVFNTVSSHFNMVGYDRNALSSATATVDMDNTLHPQLTPHALASGSSYRVYDMRKQQRYNGTTTW